VQVGKFSSDANAKDSEKNVAALITIAQRIKALQAIERPKAKESNQALTKIC